MREGVFTDAVAHLSGELGLLIPRHPVLWESRIATGSRAPDVRAAMYITESGLVVAADEKVV